MIYLPPRRAVDVQQAAALLAGDSETPIMDLARSLGWAYDRLLIAGQRAVERGLLDSIPQHPRTDSCPECGAQRFELVVVPTRFYCRRCRVATEGPNTEPPSDPEPEQASFFDDTADQALESELADESAPVDEGMAWVGEEGPDE